MQNYQLRSIKQPLAPPEEDVMPGLWTLVGQQDKKIPNHMKDGMLIFFQKTTMSLVDLN